MAPSKTANQLAELLRSSREAAGLSQGDVAEALGYGTRQFISNWERGISSPPLRTLKKLGKLYSISPDRLYEALLEETLNRVELNLHREYYGRGRKKRA